MESIREICSFSHNGIDYMWYPFSAKLDPNNISPRDLGGYMTGSSVQEQMS